MLVDVGDDCFERCDLSDDVVRLPTTQLGGGEQHRPDGVLHMNSHRITSLSRSSYTF